MDHMWKIFQNRSRFNCFSEPMKPFCVKIRKNLQVVILLVSVSLNSLQLITFNLFIIDGSADGCQLLLFHSSNDSAQSCCCCCLNGLGLNSPLKYLLLHLRCLVLPPVGCVARSCVCPSSPEAVGSNLFATDFFF